MLSIYFHIAYVRSRFKILLSPLVYILSVMQCISIDIIYNRLITSIMYPIVLATTTPNPSYINPADLRTGNDNSSVNRQSRSQQLRPDPVPGAPYAGTAGQKMGSSLLKRYNQQQHTAHRSGAISNKAVSNKEP